MMSFLEKKKPGGVNSARFLYFEPLFQKVNYGIMMISGLFFQRTFLIGIFIVFSNWSFGQDNKYLLQDTANANLLFKEAKDLFKTNEWEYALIKLDSAYKIFSTTLGKSSIEFGEVTYYKAIAFHNLMKIDISIELYLQSITIRSKILGKNSPRLGNSYHNLGVCFAIDGQFDNAIDFFQRALDVRLLSLGGKHIDIAWGYHNIGNCYAEKGDPSKGIYYHLKALNIMLEILNKTHPDIATIYGNIGLCYEQIGDFDKALHYYQAAINIHHRNKIENATIYDDMGICYWHKKEYSKAIQLHQKAISIDSILLGVYHPALEGRYANLGVAYLSTGEIKQAKVNFQKALNLNAKYNKIQNRDAAGTYLNLGLCQFKENKYTEALNQFLLSNISNNYVEKKLENVISISILLENLMLNYNCEMALFEKNNTNKNLLNAIEISKQAREAIKFQLRLLSKGKSRNLVYGQSKSVYENSIKVALLWEKQSNLRDFETSFSLTEFSKSLFLFESLKETDALAFANIPDSLLQKEHDLRIDITWREKQRQEKLNAGLEETDTTVLRISSILFDLRQEYEALKTRFEQEYPDYYRLKYDLSTTSLAYIQDTLLSPTQTLLEYFVGDSSIFIFTVGKGRYDVVEVKKDFPLEDWVKQLQQGIYGYYGKKDAERTDALSALTKQQYAEVGHQLYQKLIAPMQDRLTEDLVIVPDGVLGYVPFEALLKERPTQFSNYSLYPFLVKDHRISYCYSATLLREMKEKRHKQPPTKPFVAFAPFYEGSYEKAESTVDVRFDTLADGRDTVIVDDVVTRKEFKSLPASGEETATAAKLWRGEYFLNADATEQRFYDLAGGYRIVHLSTHGIADARVGDYSYLAFAEQKDSIENEFLYVRDLYNTQLNADLVVLSACETAQGELQRGEGIISLARAFAYAGAKSIVTTLWTVDDSASKDLTKAFYLQLKKGKTKDAALQAAKLKLVNGKDAKRQHPFFWAGFIGVGDMSAVK